MRLGDFICDHADRLPETHAALAYAERLHQGQQRQVDGAPFICHPLEVAMLLYAAGAPDHLIAAGALHDTLEKTDVEASELRRRFGARVAGLVEAVSEDPRVAGYSQRKAALRSQVADAGEEALTLFAADKLAKARELRHQRLRRAPSGRQLAHYRTCLSLLEKALPDSPLVRDLRTELKMLRRAGRPPVLLAAAR